MSKHIFIKVLSLLSLLSAQQNVSAQFDEGYSITYSTNIDGTMLAPGATTLTDPSSFLQQTDVVKNVISLQVNENRLLVCTGFTLQVDILIEKWMTPASTPQTETRSLGVSFDPAGGARFDARSSISFDGFQKVKVTVNKVALSVNVPGCDPGNMFSLVNDMRITSYNPLPASSSSLGTADFETPVEQDGINLIWTWSGIRFGNMNQLEYTWVEDDTKSLYIQNGVLNTNLLFENNSTRLDVDSRYGFGLVLVRPAFPGSGTLYYRVRDVYRKNNGRLIEGHWSAVQQYVYAGHEKSLNWQSSSSFAEDGKVKTVIQYFDGTMRVRQTISPDNAFYNINVGETIYDLQGRPNVQILPTPTLSNEIQYFRDFNRFKGQTKSDDDPAKFFDLSLPGLQCSAAPPLDTALGTARYYSTNNDWLNFEEKSNYTPLAYGYPYSETRYTDDATGRISAQGGVGRYHQIGSGHETKYFYGKPNQQELDALFGTEVGDASHYSKNMVRDANGQMSVSYVDMHGRTVATALAGDAPANVESIVNSTDYPIPTGALTNQLLTTATNIVSGNSIEAVNALLVPVQQQYNFTYKLDPAILSQYGNAINKQVCFDCKYDLEISIRPEDCANAAPIVKRYNNLQIVAEDKACGTAMGFVGEGITVPTNQISFSQTLAPGSWIVRKTLTINEPMFAARRELALKAFLVKTEQDIYDDVFAAQKAASGCTLPAGNTSACERCLAQLGSYDDYQTNYLNAIGNPVGYDLSTIRAQYTQESLTCAEACGRSAKLSTLAGLREQMLADMIPYTGQYAIAPAGIASTSEQAKYNIFTTTPVVSGKTKPFYKNPHSEGSAAAPYYNADKTEDKDLYDAAGNYLLPSMSVDEFTKRFQPSWAGSLLYYHPEFSKLQFAEANLVSSYEWADKISFVDTYAQAQASGYLAPLTSDPYFVNNYTAADKQNMLQYISSFVPGGDNTAAGNPSIWQLANSAVLCDEVADDEKNSCLLRTNKTGVDAAITTTADKDKAWQQFRSVYLSYRNEMLVKYINKQTGSLSSTAAANLQAEGKQLVFTTMQQLADQNGIGAVWNKAASISNASDAAALETVANTFVTNKGLNIDKCEAQRPFWASKLSQCEPLMVLLKNATKADTLTVKNILSSILDGMVSVCHNSQTALQPYGASTVDPAKGGSPTSFEEVITRVFHANNIGTGDVATNYFCNPFSVDAPKPFAKNGALFINYSNKIDSCGCKRFTALKQEAIAGGYSTASMTSMNGFLLANYQETLTQTVWNGLQKCSSIFTNTCATSAVSTPDNTVLTNVATNAGSQPGSNLTVPNCMKYIPIALTAVEAIPAFLSCDYQKPCISCGQFTALTTQFKTLYPTYTGVPYTSNTATDAQTQQNRLWTRFMNYRTGFSYNALDYIKAFTNCTAGTSSAYIGNGNDCGTNSAVNTLLVNERLAPNPAKYVARQEIIFQGTFTSNSADEFTADIDNDLGTCNNITGIAGASVFGEGSYAMCAFEKRLNDITRYERTPADPCSQAESQSQFIAQLLFRRIKDSLTANFNSLYLAKCLGAQNMEQFYATYQPKEYHYTLYYYDQAGNLVKTIPPAAVKPNYSASYFADVATKRTAAADVSTSNNEALATQYRYNTLNQVVTQQTPDAGVSKFWYDRLGRLSVSQNALQVINKQYSYTQYDALGRITEVGQRPQATVMTQMISQDATRLQSWLNDNAAGNKEQITLTVYDVAFAPIAVTGPNNTVLYQQNLRNRVSYSMVFDNASQQQNLVDGTVMGGNSATYYSYDIHGNVDTLLQDYGNSTDVPNKMNSTGNRFKKIAYNYDLISGKVNLVSYQWKQPDQFFHRYRYDESNRIVEVTTSQDSLFWEKDAGYEYYRHGPLAATTLGQNFVQQLNYAYTLQGWLKGVNSNRMDDRYGRTGNTYAYGYMLTYFAGDYKAINTTSAAAFTNLPPILPSSTTGAGLYNGNISSMLVNFFAVSNNLKPLVYGYRYDQLNRLVAMDAFEYNSAHVSTADGYDVVSAIPDYKERISYDPNGNIKSYLRNGTTQGGTSLAMDNLTYQYEKNSAGLTQSNKLRYVHDQVASTNYTTDLDNQTSNTLAQVQAEKSKGIASDNYQYDAIGNLIKDSKNGISNIQWTVYGKIKNITKTDGTIIKYSYDAAGNRISKTVTVGAVTQGTFYVRDATGNTLSIYNSGNAAINGGHLTQSELTLYGSSRLGVYSTKVDVESPVINGVTNFTRGNKSYELTNHLGNVLATISDKAGRTLSGGWYAPSFEAVLLTAKDYAPFGASLPGRSYNLLNSSYRYGFNGKENDNEVKGEGNQQDYGMRIYDPRLGRFLSVDPIAPKYPELTPYQFASNTPIQAIDLDGLERLDMVNINANRRTATINIVHAAQLVQNNLPTELTALNNATYTSSFQNTTLYTRALPQNGQVIDFITQAQYNSGIGYALNIQFNVVLTYVANSASAATGPQYSTITVGPTNGFSQLMTFAHASVNTSNTAEINPLFPAFAANGANVTILENYEELIAHEIGFHNMMGLLHTPNAGGTANYPQTNTLESNLHNHILSIDDDVKKILSMNITNRQNMTQGVVLPHFQAPTRTPSASSTLPTPIPSFQEDETSPDYMKINNNSDN